MATQLGEISIDTVKGTRVTGSFRSVYDKNVGKASPAWGAALLHDAFAKLLGEQRSVANLKPHVRAVKFKTPNRDYTTFTVEVDDAAVLAGLGPGAWDSYYLG